MANCQQQQSRSKASIWHRLIVFNDRPVSTYSVRSVLCSPGAMSAAGFDGILGVLKGSKPSPFPICGHDEQLSQVMEGRFEAQVVELLHDVVVL